MPADGRRPGLATRPPGVPSPAHWQTFAELAGEIRRAPARFGGRRLVAVDGPSGSGKTRFADRLGAALGAPVVHTDDLLDGWDDQFTFWERLERLVLTPLRRGVDAFFPAYDWGRGEFGGPAVRVPAAEVLIVEGVSAARRAIRPELSLAVFVTAPPALCLARAVARDGDDSVAFRQYLERWRTAEQRHFAADATAARAGLLVDGAAEDDDRFARLAPCDISPADRRACGGNGDGP